jgi:predicted ArsR family transcriptional regulator
MNDELRLAILEDLKKYLSRPGLEPGEVTARMVAKEVGVSHKVARNALDNLVNEGKYTVRKVFINGYWNNAYKKASRPETGESCQNISP